MAFSNAVIEKIILPGGLILERGTWTGSAVTTGTITADATSINGVNMDISEIYWSEFTSDSDDVVKVAGDVGPTKRKLTFTSGDTGRYNIIGRAT